MKQGAFERVVLRPLSKDEIDGRIDTLVQVLATADENPVPGRPCWISARELVRRMRPFLVMN
jgi:hypothetical protein